MTVNVQATGFEQIFPDEWNDYGKFYTFLFHETVLQQTLFSWNVLEDIPNITNITEFCTLIRDFGECVGGSIYKSTPTVNKSSYIPVSDISLCLLTNIFLVIVWARKLILECMFQQNFCNHILCFTLTTTLEKS
jgi:hypothetical protein